MVHGKRDTNHGAVNPPFGEDGFSEPAERPWGNPTHQHQMIFPAMAPPTGKMGELALQPAKAWTHPDKLRSRSLPLLSCQGKGLTSFAARYRTVPTKLRTGKGAGISQYRSVGPGLRHTGMN